MKMFGGTFNKFENFRYELKKGAPESVFAIVAFVVLSIVGLMIVGVIAIMLNLPQETLGLVAKTYFWLVGLTFMYNVIKAAFECFLHEREEFFDTLKR
jgi:hypothetical protein